MMEVPEGGMVRGGIEGEVGGRRLDTPLVNELKTSMSLGRDIRFALTSIEVLTTMLSLPQQTEGAEVAGRALFSSAAVSYARCFASGRRKKIPVDILDLLPPIALAVHERVVQLRNQHIAHSVDPTVEKTEVRYSALDDGTTGLLVLSVGMVAPTGSECVAFRDLLAALDRYFEWEYEVLADRVIAEEERARKSTKG